MITRLQRKHFDPFLGRKLGDFEPPPSPYQSWEKIESWIDDVHVDMQKGKMQLFSENGDMHFFLRSL